MDWDIELYEAIKAVVESLERSIDNALLLFNT